MQSSTETHSASRSNVAKSCPTKGFWDLKNRSSREELFRPGLRLCCSRSAADQDSGRRISQKASEKDDKQRDDDGSLGRACMRAGHCSGGCCLRSGSGATASTGRASDAGTASGRPWRHDGSGPPRGYAQAESQSDRRPDLSGEGDLRGQPHKDGGTSLEYVAIAG